eukprot:5922698-Alexandrium_andersonii.AAC.1
MVGHSAKLAYAHGNVPDKSAVTPDWKERVAEVTGAVAIAQEQGALGGTLKGSHAHLHLPYSG